jgi:hypothetical protein
VLFSSVPLTSSLALTLYEAARGLWAEDRPSCEVAGDTVSGRLRNLREEVVLGGISGPAFEARLETERGAATVRFLITRDGLRGARQKAKRKELLN